MELSTPTFMSGILGQQGLTQRWGYRRLLAGVLTTLAAQHADRVMPFVPAPVEPSLDRGDAEADRSAGARMAPFACRQLLQGRAQRALGRRRGQQLANEREAQPRPAFMHPRSDSLRHV